MIEKLKQRLEQLHGEYEAGQKMLVEFDAKRGNLAQAMLRIVGAMTVLRELLAQVEAAARPEEKKA